jgi:hypothetical protein
MPSPDPCDHSLAQGWRFHASQLGSREFHFLGLLPAQLELSLIQCHTQCVRFDVLLWWTLFIALGAGMIMRNFAKGSSTKGRGRKPFTILNHQHD